MRWITWIWLFDFNIKHVLGRKYIVANNLLCRLYMILEVEEEEEEENIKDFMDA
jgi:hypothetical protein